MSEIVYVSPLLYLNSNANWKSSDEKPGYIPILRADLYKFQESLKELLSSRNSHHQDSGGKEFNSLEYHANANTTTRYADNASPDGAGQRAKEPTKKFQSLQQFLPISLNQQLHMVSIMGVSARVPNRAVEAFLCDCIRLLLQHVQAAEERYEDFWQSWTTVPCLETQEIFLRFSDIDNELFASVIGLLQGWIQSEEGPRHAEIHMDANTERLIKDQKPAKSYRVDSNLVEALNRLWQDSERSSTDKGLEQEANDVEYQVDLSTLSDLPHDSLDHLCQDIISFRTRVLTKEREKQVRESYEENKRRRQRMMKIFDHIRKTRDDAGEGEDQEDDDEEDDDDNDEGIEHEEEDDWTLEKRRQDRQKDDSDRRYAALLKNLQAEWEPKLSSLHTRLQRARNYDDVKLQEQQLHIKQLSHLSADPLYDHKRSYRLLEEQKDQIDRVECVKKTELDVENKECPIDNHAHINKYEAQDLHKQPSQPQFKIDLALNKAIDNSKSVSGDENQRIPASTTPAAPDILPQDGLETKLQDLNRSGLVQALVQEYLGVYEQELVDYILDTIREKRNKAALLAELKETFDDDAATIVESIWESGHLTGS